MRPSGPEREPGLPAGSAEPIASARVPNLPVIPDYEVLKRIGSGAYGDVWLVRNLLGTYRAAKVVYRRSFERDQPFEREFRGIQRFEPISHSHESQVKILHIGRNDQAGYFYYVMELADDATEERSDGVLECGSDGEPSAKPSPTAAQLSDAPTPLHSNTLLLQDPNAYVPRTLKLELERRDRLPLEECLRIGLSLATALEHLHAHGLIHRDVKPSNIIFVNGRPKLADIGLVTDVEATRSFVGTEGFIPPEGPGSTEADLYSLGKVLYEMSMGRSRLDFPALPTNWDELPADEQKRLLELNEVLVKACEADPRQRYQSAEQMRKELALLEQGQSVRRKRASARRWAVGAKVGLATVAVALLLLAWPFLRGPKAGHTPDLETLRLYEDGRWHYSMLTPEHHVLALKSLTQAVQRDPQFLQPYAEMAALYAWAMLPEVTNDTVRLLRTREIADKALAVDPNQAEGHIALSWCRFLERDWRAAEDEIVRAIQLNPRVAIAHDIYSFYLTMLERYPEAHREAQRAEEVETSASKRTSAIVDTWPFIGERRFDLAEARLKQVLEMDENFAWGHLYLGFCYQDQFKYLESLDEFKKYDVLAGPAQAKLAPAYDAVRQAYESQGEQGYWRKVIEITLAQRVIPADQRLVSELFNETYFGGYYAKLGEKQKALDELEKHFDEVNVWNNIKFEPIYDNLHGEPRYHALVRRAKLQP